MKVELIDVYKKFTYINLFIGIDETIIRFTIPANISSDNHEIYYITLSNKQLKDLGLIIAEKTSIKG